MLALMLGGRLRDVRAIDAIENGGDVNQAGIMQRLVGQGFCSLLSKGAGAGRERGIPA